MNGTARYVAVCFAYLLTAICLEAGSVAYTYDGLSRLTRVVYSNGTTITYTYDAGGNQNSRTVVLGAGIIPLPTFTNLSQSSGGRGLVVNVVLNGTDFAVPMTVNVDSGITVSNVIVTSPASATALFSISPNAALGDRSVSITTDGGTSDSLPFTVVSLPLPTLTGIAPNSGPQGVAITIALSGTNFLPSMVVDPGSGITVSNLTVPDSTSAAATFTILVNANLGSRNVTVTTSSGTSGTANFTVIPAGRRQRGQITSQDN